MILNTPSIEFPSEPIPFEEGLAADREVIAAKRSLANEIDDEIRCFGDEPSHEWNFPAVLDAWKRVLRAEARAQEIAIHNNLFQIGKVQRAQLIATPNLGGRIA